MKAGTFNLFAGSSLLALASVAGAQTAVEEIVVTARHIEEKLQDVPISITVFNEEQLAKANVVNATDLAKITPSLSANNNFGNENASFAIRGFVQDNGTPPSVGVYFADVVAPRAFGSGVQVGDGAGPGNFFDLQKSGGVQVLKGPQGTLQGRNTTGGAILFVPRKPEHDFGGYAEVAYGNYDMLHTQGAINVPIGDTVRFRLAADTQTRDGYAKNNSGEPNSKKDFYDVNYYALRASLVVDVTPSLETYFIGSYSKSDTNGNVQKLIACDHVHLGLPEGCDQLSEHEGEGFYTLQSSIENPRSVLEQKQVINTTTWQASDALTLKNIISYAELSDTLRSSLFGTDFHGTIDSDGMPAYVPSLPLSYVQPPAGGKTADQSTFTEEFRVLLTGLDDRLTYQGGLYFESSRPLSKSGNFSPFLISCSDIAHYLCTDYLGGPNAPVGSLNYTVGETDTRSRAVYSQASYAITDQFKVTAGYRYTWDRHRNTSTHIVYVNPNPANLRRLSDPLVPFCGEPATDTDHTPRHYYADGIGASGDVADGCVLHLEKKSSAPTWLIDFDYKPTDDMLLYASYKRGYRAGGVMIGAPSDKHIFEPEEVDTYELGLKSSFRGTVSGTFNAALFYNDFTNQQLELAYIADSGSHHAHTTSILNAGKSEIYGAEIEATIKPIESLVLAINYAYLHAEIKKVDQSLLESTDPAYSTHPPPVEAGNTIALSPRNKYSISATYTLPLNDNIGKISAGVMYVHTDKQLSNYTYINDHRGSLGPNPNYATAAGGDYGTLQARDLLNANVDWNSIMGLPLDLSFFGTNLTDQKYYNFVPGLIAAGFEVASLGEPRMVGARLRYRFGGE